MKTLIVVLLLTLSAIGQNALQEQKACYDAAVNQAHNENSTLDGNYLNQDTHECWIRISQTWDDTINKGDQRGWYQIFVIYQRQPKASFLGSTIAFKGGDWCDVAGVRCHGLEEWSDLAKKKYPELF